MDNLATAVDNILKQSEDVSRRLASIENNMHSANYPGSSADLTTRRLDDNLSMIAVDDLTITRNDDATIAPLNHNTSNTKPTIPLATGSQLDSFLESANFNPEFTRDWHTDVYRHLLPQTWTRSMECLSSLALVWRRSRIYQYYLCRYLALKFGTPSTTEKQVTLESSRATAK